MKRFWILITLTGFMLIISQVAFSASEKEQKGKYQKQSETKLEEFKQKMEELKGKAVELKEDAQKEFNEQMEELKKKEGVANQKLKQLKSAGTKTWRKLKADMDGAIDELNKLYDKTMSHFSKK
jgi:TolA-binding protein